MFNRLKSVEEKYLRLEEQLSNAEILANQKEYQKIAKEHADISSIVETYRQHKRLSRQIQENQDLLEEEQDPEMRELFKHEVAQLLKELNDSESELKLMLVPKDPLDDKNVILEIRAGTGGDEAALFVADLFRMYSRYAELRRWKVEILDAHPTGIGGFKEIVAEINGKRAFSRMKYERGVHRVQRVPVTESQGRIHTSAVTVAVLPEAEEVDVFIDPNELRVDVFRSSGPGGQSVNTTDSAVRITHVPTGLVEVTPGFKVDPATLLAALDQYGILHLLIRDWEKAKQVLEQSGFVVKQTEVVAVEVANKPGGLAELLAPIEKSGQNIEYMYAFGTGSKSKAVMIFRFHDTDKAIAALQAAGVNVVSSVELLGE